MDENEWIALLTLQQIPNLGDGSIKKLIRVFGSAQEVLKQKKGALLQVDGIGSHKLEAINDPQHRILAEAELAFAQKHQIQYTAYTESNYPERLKYCIDSPVVLFSKGAVNWNNPKIISIVGTRKITSYGTAFLEKFIADIAPLNPIIVSGFAYGTDITAHKAALQNDLQTIGVLAHGLNQLYPKIHAKYASDILRNGGFVTDFWSSHPFVHTNFLQRNRIIAGLSEATIVVESAKKGGSLVTANFANGYAREVFAVPGRVHDHYSIGCNSLIKSAQAHLLTSAADLCYILNWKAETAPKSVQKQLFVSLTKEEEIVHQFLEGKEKILLDTIAMSCKMPTYKVASILLTMELKGVVRPLPGKLFELT